MKRYVWSIVLMTMFLPTAVFCQEPEPKNEPEYQMELHERQLELQQREAEMAFERERQQLELEKRKIELEHLRNPRKHWPGPLLIVLLIVHILAAVWVYQDIRQRGCGSGIWVVIALLTGLLGALVYAVVRLGDSGSKKKA